MVCEQESARASILGPLGWTDHEERERAGLAREVVPARVTFASRGEGRATGARGERRVVLAGKLTEDDVAIVAGDWVGLRAGIDGEPAPIDHVFSRRTSLARKEAGRRARAQLLAANVDTVLVVHGLDAPFNPRRVERFVAMAIAGGARPVLVMTKADLCDDVASRLDEARALGAIEIVVASARDGRGLGELRAFAGSSETIALVGPSGVGKSAITNHLLERAAQREGGVREADHKGRHTTAHRELFPLDGGGAVLDTPGLRELAIWADDDEAPAGFDDVSAAAARCRFRDCAHEREPGCAVRDAIASGALDADRFAAWTKLAAEARALQARVEPRARIAAKRHVQALTRAMRTYPKR